MTTDFEDRLRTALREELSGLDQQSLGRTTLPPPAPRSHRGALISVVAAVLVITLTTSIVVLSQRHSNVASPPVAPSTTGGTSASSPTMVVVPDLAGMDSTAAKALVQQGNLRYVERPVYSGQPKGSVVRQDPAAGATAAPGSTVTVYISLGAGMVVVPDTASIVGKDLRAATAILTAARLQVVSQYQPSTQPKDRVLAMDLQPGDQVPAGTVVTLQVSDNSQMTVPDLSRLTPDQALAALKQVQWAGADSGLVQSTQEDPNAVLWGLIISQQPVPNAVVDKNLVIAVTIATEPHIPMPDLTGKTVAAARQELAATGWFGQLTVAIHQELTPTTANAGKIFQQDPDPTTLILVTDPISVDVYPAR